MKRRTFLKALAALPLVAGMARPPVGVETPATLPPIRPYRKVTASYTSNVDPGGCGWTDLDLTGS